MKTVTINFVKLSDKAVVPVYGKNGDAGADLTATSILETDMYIEYGTDLALDIPPGFAGLIYPRSSLSNYDLVLSNHVGVIDSNYRGEIKFRFKKTLPKLMIAGRDCSNPNLYEVGDRIGQLIVQEIPRMLFEEVQELEQSNRGSLGYGSSGK